MKNLHAHLFFARQPLFFAGGEVPGSSESRTDSGYNVEGLVEEWTRDGVDFAKIEKSIDSGALSVKDLEKVIRILEEQEVDLDERMFQLTSELKEYIFTHGEVAEEREMNEKAVALDEFQKYVKAGKYELALSYLWEIPDQKQVVTELKLVASKQPEALVPYLEALSKDDAVLKLVLATMQENASLDDMLSKAFVGFQVEEPYAPSSWFEKMGVTLKILEQNKDSIWFDRPTIEKQMNDAFLAFLKRGWAEVGSFDEDLLAAYNSGIALDAARLKPILEKRITAGLPTREFEVSNWLHLKQVLDTTGIQLDMELLNKAVVRNIQREFSYLHDFESLQMDCRAFKNAGFPLNEELLAFSENKEKALEYKAREVAAIDLAIEKKDYETVALSLYELSDDLPKFKSTVEILLQNAPEFLVRYAHSVSLWASAERSWGSGILKDLATRVDVGKILAAQISEKEGYSYGVDLGDWSAFKEANVVFNEALVIAAFNSRLFAEYEAHEEELVPYEVDDLMTSAELYKLPFDKDKVSYYANARLLTRLDAGEESPRFYLLELRYDIEEMERCGLKVDRDNVDEKVNAYIKNYLRAYADDPSSALYLDDLVSQAKEAGVKLDKQIFELAR